MRLTWGQLCENFQRVPWHRARVQRTSSSDCHLPLGRGRIRGTKDKLLVASPSDPGGSPLLRGPHIAAAHASQALPGWPETRGGGGGSSSFFFACRTGKPFGTGRQVRVPASLRAGSPCSKARAPSARQKCLTKAVTLQAGAQGLFSGSFGSELAPVLSTGSHPTLLGPSSSPGSTLGSLWLGGGGGQGSHTPFPLCAPSG